MARIGFQCPHCGKRHPAGAGFCPTTGKKIVETVGFGQRKASSNRGSWMAMLPYALLSVGTISIVVGVMLLLTQPVAVAGRPSLGGIAIVVSPTTTNRASATSIQSLPTSTSPARATATNTPRIVSTPTSVALYDIAQIRNDYKYYLVGASAGTSLLYDTCGEASESLRRLGALGYCSIESETLGTRNNSLGRFDVSITFFDSTNDAGAAFNERANRGGDESIPLNANVNGYYATFNNSGRSEVTYNLWIWTGNLFINVKGKGPSSRANDIAEDTVLNVYALLNRLDEAR